MKKTILSVILSLAVVTVFGQNFKVSDKDGKDITNTVVNVDGSGQTYDLAFDFQNLRTDTAEVMLKRYELNVITGTKNYFCWGDCFEPADAGKFPEWFALEEIPVAPNEVEGSSQAYYKPEGNPGISSFLFVWYDINDPNDSVWVELNFDAPAWVGVNELDVASVSFKASPNPALDLVTINYDLGTLSSPNASVVLMDILGKEKAEIRLNNNLGKVQLDVSDFAPGVYFYAIRTENQVIATKKLIVQ